MKKSVAVCEVFGLTPPLRREPAVNVARRGGEGVEELKEAGAFDPPSLLNLPRPRRDSFMRRPTLAGPHALAECPRRRSPKQSEGESGAKGIGKRRA